jgi:hypothetical protein
MPAALSEVAMVWLCCCVAVGGRASASRSNPGGVAPRAAVATPMKSSPGRAWLVARALPRHAGQVNTWAIGEHLLLLSATLYSPMTTVSDHLVMIWCSKLPNLACDAAT